MESIRTRVEVAVCVFVVTFACLLGAGCDGECGEPAEKVLKLMRGGFGSALPKERAEEAKRKFDKEFTRSSMVKACKRERWSERPPQITSLKKYSTVIECIRQAKTANDLLFNCGIAPRTPSWARKRR